MAGFKELEGDFAIVVQGGVFRQCDLYERAGFLFIKTSGGFVKVYANGSTSKSNVRLDELSFDGDLWADRFGKVRLVDGDKYKPLRILAPDDAGTVPLIESKS